METVAYLQLAQDYETSEFQEAISTDLQGMKLSKKTLATAVGVTGTALMVGALAEAPALAYRYGCCQPVVYQPIVFRPVVIRPISTGCFQSCYYPQPYSYQSYTPDYYYDQSYDYEETSSGCGCSSEESYEESYEEGGYDDYTEIAFFPVGDSNFLTLGASGQIVALLQQALIDQGFDPGPVDGLFGHQTAEAVAQYQAAAGLLVDGIAGGQTLDSLGLAGAGA